VFNNAIAAAAAADPDVLPLDLFRNVMRNSDLPLDTRIMAAQSALPYVHAKPSGRGQRPEPGASRLKFRPAGTAAGERGMAPLDFLLRVMRDPETTSHIRMRVGSIVAPYVHRKAEPRQPSAAVDLEVDDEYGFVVDWDKAKALLDLEDAIGDRQVILRTRESRGHLLVESRYFWVVIAEQTKGLVCAPGYRWADRYKDRQRFMALREKQGAASREKTSAEVDWTAEDETELIYLAARIASHDNSEEGIAARERYRAWYLQKKDPFQGGEKELADDDWRKIRGNFEPIPYGPDGLIFSTPAEAEADDLADATWWRKYGARTRLECALDVPTHRVEEAKKPEQNHWDDSDDSDLPNDALRRVLALARRRA
jgi:hypothetical protein